MADYIKRQVHELSTSVYQIRGHIKGKTLLPFPQVNYVSYELYLFFTEKYCNLNFHIIKTFYVFLQQGAARIAEEEKRVRESKGEECDMTLKNNIEGIIIKWAYQTDEVNLRQNDKIL